jgi:hypothetical protein
LIWLTAPIFASGSLATGAAVMAEAQAGDPSASGYAIAAIIAATGTAIASIVAAVVALITALRKPAEVIVERRKTPREPDELRAELYRLQRALEDMEEAESDASRLPAP